jgi:alpha-L-arabinofuranosidase
MTGLEKNAGVVGLACYAPMLCNVGYVNWKPDMIWFDNHRAYGTANYYVQKLFMNNMGDCLVDIEATKLHKVNTENKFENKISGKIRLSGIESKVSYSDISIVNDDTGERINFPDCNLKNDEVKEIANINFANYTLMLKAVENEGLKGFEIDFGYKDKDNHFLWLMGGWQNQDTAITERIKGRNSDLSQCQFSVEKNRIYSLKLVVRGRCINTYIDGAPVHTTKSKLPIKQALYYTASLNEKDNEVILKAVNLNKNTQTAEIKINGYNIGKIKAYQMAGWDLDTENDFDNPTLISPKEWWFDVEGDCFNYEFIGESITVFRIKIIK